MTAGSPIDVVGDVVGDVVAALAGAADAERMRHLARRADDVADRLRARATHLDALRDTERFWDGPAAGAFAAQLGGLCGQARGALRHVEELAGALRRYAALLDAAADLARRPVDVVTGTVGRAVGGGAR